MDEGKRVETYLNVTIEVHYSYLLMILYCL